MANYRKCDTCNVEVSSDLSNCPLCGKYVLNDKRGDEIQENQYSFPKYSFHDIYRTKWVNIIRVMFWLAGIISVIINLIWTTQPYFFPYVVTALIVTMTVFVEPISKKRNYTKLITRSSIIISIFIIFIDAYDYFTLGTTFGWAFSYTVPFLLSGVVLASAIICLASKRLEVDMLKSVGLLMIYSIVYFLVVLLGFENLAVWPSLVFMCVSVGWFGLLQAIKSKILWRELGKNFHI